MSKLNIAKQLAALSSESKESKPVIVAYGLMNAGKSSLLNMLTAHIEQEFFKTNDVRETAEVKRFESEKYVYLDTPGLDANDLDDELAESGVSNADVVLFLHQPQGALEANEISFLKNLKKSFGDLAQSNIILALSKIEKESAEKIALIEDEIKKQCEAELNFSPRIFRISNKRYQTGIMKHKDGLVNQSHIKSLIEYIDTVTPNSMLVRKQRNLVKIDQLLVELTAQKEHLEQKRRTVTHTIEQGFSVFGEQIELLNNFLDESSQQYQAI